MKIYKAIDNWDEWKRPKHPEKHWKPGRSAMELAKAFFRGAKGGPQLPRSLARLFQTSRRFSDLVVHEGIPELLTDLPPRESSGPRNHDLWLRGQTATERVGISVEAKADEPFDRVLGRKYTKASRKRANRSNSTKSESRVMERCAMVARLVLGREIPHQELLSSPLRYQLLSGVAGTLLQAASERRALAAFVVYEFSGAATTERKRRLNLSDYEAFIRQLPGLAASSRIPPTVGLVGPITYAPNDILPNDVELWIGKVTDEAEAS